MNAAPPLAVIRQTSHLAIWGRGDWTDQIHPLVRSSLIDGNDSFPPRPLPPASLVIFSMLASQPQEIHKPAAAADDTGMCKSACGVCTDKSQRYRRPADKLEPAISFSLLNDSCYKLRRCQVTLSPNSELRDGGKNRRDER